MIRLILKKSRDCLPCLVTLKHLRPASYGVSHRPQIFKVLIIRTDTYLGMPLGWLKQEQLLTSQEILQTSVQGEELLEAEKQVKYKGTAQVRLKRLLFIERT